MDSVIPFESIATLFAFGALILNIFSIFILGIFIAGSISSKNSRIKKIRMILKSYSLYVGFFAALGATAGSLFMSELGGLEPCTLCWYQRIFMYPQVFIFLLAAYYKDMKVFLYSLFLSSIGLILALWHIFIEYHPEFETCSENSVACSTIQFEAFGFVTIPFMSASIFLFLVALALLGLQKSSK